MARFLSITLAALALGCSGGTSSRCTVAQNADGSATITCDDGTMATVRNGMDGAGCTVVDDGMGTKTITCEDGTTVTVTDGMNGNNGNNGVNALASGPGLQVEIRQVGIDTDRRPFAELRFTDGDDRPLDREGRMTQGAVTTSFTIAYLPTETRIDGEAVLPYSNYITRTVMSADGMRSATQPGSDSAGTWTAVDPDDGVYRYAFDTVLPDAYPADKTHTIALYATRTFDEVRYVSNATTSFRPDGMPVTQTRSLVTNDACNTCHTPLSAHGGARQDVVLCQTCHARGYEDPDSGNTLDFENMVHRIHRGANLPSVRAGGSYEIVGFRNTVHDYSTIHFPQDIRNCDTCHQGPDGQRWNTEPTRAACGSCHDDLWFEPGDPPAGMRLHPGGDRPDDDRCTVCHEPTEPALSPIVERHFTKFQLPSAVDIEARDVAATMTASRQIQLDFTIVVNGMPRDILATPLTSLSAVVAGPTTDYLFNTSFTLTSASAGTLAAIDAPAGRFRWTSAATVDTIAANAAADPLRGVAGLTASGSWAIGLQATLRTNGPASTTTCTGTSTATCTAPTPEGGRWGCVSGLCTAQYDYAALNPVAYFAITDTTVVTRRQVVIDDNCNACHEQLFLHGGGRNNAEYCAMCHNSTFDTIDRMPVPTGTQVVTRSLSLANFVHRVHTGEQGVSPAVYWGPRPASPINAGGNPVDLGEVRFPADRRACDRCHVDMSTATDIETLQARRAPRTRLINDTRTILETYTIGATASACTGCHDQPASIAHAETMTTALGGEACLACHGAGSTFGVDVVHARPELATP